MQIIHATLTTDKGKREGFVRLLSKLVGPSRAETGNLMYDTYQSLEDPEVFIVVERWSNESAVKAHFETPHFKAFVQEVEKLVVKPPDIKIYEAKEVKSAS